MKKVGVIAVIALVLVAAFLLGFRMYIVQHDVVGADLFWRGPEALLFVGVRHGGTRPSLERAAPESVAPLVTQWFGPGSYDGRFTVWVFRITSDRVDRLSFDDIQLGSFDIVDGAIQFAGQVEDQRWMGDHFEPVPHITTIRPIPEVPQPDEWSGEQVWVATTPPEGETFAFQLAGKPAQLIRTGKLLEFMTFKLQRTGTAPVELFTLDERPHPRNMLQYRAQFPGQPDRADSR